MPGQNLVTISDDMEMETGNMERGLDGRGEGDGRVRRLRENASQCIFDGSLEYLVSESGT